jgi:hypothetical protein
MSDESPITTTFDSSNYIVSAKTILAEFIDGALDDPDCDIVFSYPQNLEIKGATLSKPLIWIRDMPSTTANIGSGKQGHNGRAVRKRLQYALYIIAENKNSAGKYVLDQISGKLEKYFLDYSNLLGAAGLKKASITPPTEVAEWIKLNFVGSMHSVFVEVLLT